MEEKVKVLHQQSNINDHTFRTVLEKSVVERFNGKPRVIGKIVFEWKKKPRSMMEEEDDPKVYTTK